MQKFSCTLVMALLVATASTSTQDSSVDSYSVEGIWSAKLVPPKELTKRFPFVKAPGKIGDFVLHEVRAVYVITFHPSDPRRRPFPALSLLYRNEAGLRFWLFQAPEVAPDFGGYLTLDHVIRESYFSYEHPLSHRTGTVAYYDLGTVSLAVVSPDLTLKPFKALLKPHFPQMGEYP